MTKRIITILIILISTQCFLVAQEVNGNLVSFSEKDGIPSNSIYSILQDHLGFIWIGTDNGLLKYDGYKFHRYDLNQYTFFSSLFEDSELNLWIGTPVGVVKYNRIKEDYHLYDLSAYNHPKMWLIVRTIEEDTNGTIWLALIDYYGSTIKDGLAYLKKGENDVKIFNSEHGSLGMQRIYDMEIDKKNNLWISGSEGLRKIDLTTMSVEKIEFENSPIRSFDLALLMDDNGILWGCQRNVGFGSYDPSNGNVKAYSFNSTNNNSLSNNNVNSLIQDTDGTLWLGTNNGINHFDPETGIFERYFYHQGLEINHKDIGIIETILMDKSGSLWLGSFQKFVHKFDPSKILFRSYKHEPINAPSIKLPWIFGLTEDSEGNVWIGGPNSSSLSKYNTQTNTFTQIPNDNSINRGIRTIYQDREQTIWIGSYPTGLLTFNPANSSFNNIVINFPGTDNSPGVVQFLEDHLLNFWVGTENGLFLFDRLNRKMERIIVKEIKDDILGTGRINYIFESRKKELWVSTHRRLYKYIPNRKTFKRYLHDPNNSNSLSSSNIEYIYEDKDGILWLGTGGEGLYRFDPESDTFTHLKVYPDSIYLLKNLETLMLVMVYRANSSQ
jgi:ligand-binding sensor domain-containing protein